MGTQKGSVIISGKIVLLLLITLECTCLLEQHHSTVLLLLHFNRADNFCFLCILLCTGCNTVGHESYLTKCREENKNSSRNLEHTALRLLWYFPQGVVEALKVCILCVLLICVLDI